METEFTNSSVAARIKHNRNQPIVLFRSGAAEAICHVTVLIRFNYILDSVCEVVKFEYLCTEASTGFDAMLNFNPQRLTHKTLFHNFNKIRSRATLRHVLVRSVGQSLFLQENFNIHLFSFNSTMFPKIQPDRQDL